MATVRNQNGNGKDAGGISDALNRAANLQNFYDDKGASGKPYPHSKDDSRRNQKVSSVFMQMRKIALNRAGRGMFAGALVEKVRSSHDQHPSREGRGSDTAISPAYVKARNAGSKATIANSVPQAHYGIVKPPTVGGEGKNGQARVNPGSEKYMGMTPHGKILTSFEKAYPLAPFSYSKNWGTPRFQGRAGQTRTPQVNPGKIKGSRYAKTSSPSDYTGKEPGGNPEFKGYSNGAPSLW